LADAESLELRGDVLLGGYEFGFEALGGFEGLPCDLAF
jgi:hypothetical protein